VGAASTMGSIHCRITIPFNNSVAINSSLKVGIHNSGKDEGPHRNSKI